MKYLTKKDIVDTFAGIEHYKPGRPSVKNLSIKVSSGTTGTGITVALITNPKIDTNCNFGIKHDYLYLFPRRTFYVNQANQLLRLATAKSFLFLDPSDLEHSSLVRLVLEFQPTAFLSSPSYLNYFINKLRVLEKTEFLNNIQYLYLTGETITPTLKSKIAELMPQAFVENDYALSELGLCALSCKNLSTRYPEEKSVYHPVSNITIASPDARDVGEIIVTTSMIKGYRTGDLGKLIKENCLCGKTETLILHGRKDYDVVSVVGTTFLRDEIERVFSALSMYIQDFRLEVGEHDNGIQTIGTVTLRAVPTQKLQSMSNPKNFIAQAIAHDLFVTKTRTLGQIMDAGIIRPIKIDFVDSIPHKRKAVRLLRVYD